MSKIFSFVGGAKVRSRQTNKRLIVLCAGVALLTVILSFVPTTATFARHGVVWNYDRLARIEASFPASGRMDSEYEKSYRKVIANLVDFARFETTRISDPDIKSALDELLFRYDHRNLNEDQERFDFQHNVGLVISACRSKDVNVSVPYYELTY